MQSQEKEDNAVAAKLSSSIDVVGKKTTWKWFARLTCVVSNQKQSTDGGHPFSLFFVFFLFFWYDPTSSNQRVLLWETQTPKWSSSSSSSLPDGLNQTHESFHCQIKRKTRRRGVLFSSSGSFLVFSLLHFWHLETGVLSSPGLDPLTSQITAADSYLFSE